MKPNGETKGAKKMKKWWIVGTVLVLVLCMGVSGVFAVERRSGFADADGDGVCDNYGAGGRFADTDGDGACDNYGAGGGNRYGKNGGKGCGRGKGCQ
jgi:hypothetical protein